MNRCAIPLIIIAVIALTGCQNNQMLAHTVHSQHKVVKINNADHATIKTKSNKQTIHKDRKEGSKKFITRRIRTSRVKQALLTQYKVWKHVRYQLGGKSKRGIDCSGFTQVTFKSKFNISLPSNTYQQAKKGKNIHKKQLRTGDLVFFTTGRKTRHVGIYLDQQQFLHASTSKGVVISSLNNSYWLKHYWKAVRISGI